MRGFPYGGYFPRDIPEKTASLGHNNLYVPVDTAVLEDMTPILLVSAHSLLRVANKQAEDITLFHDGHPYTFSRYDKPTQRFIFQKVPVHQDVHEGQERVDVIGKVGQATRGISRVNPNSVENWPIGGDQPEVETPGVEVVEYGGD